jgi:HAD superfamily hydrolase (TIGR01509 family)
VRYVLFDLGGVAIRTPFEMARALESRRGLAEGALGLSGPFDPGRDDLWQQRLAGDLSERRYWHEQAVRITSGVDIGDADPTRRLMDDLYDAPEDRVVRPEVVTLLDTLEERGFRIAALTNDLSRFHSAAWIDRMSVFGRFDPLIDLSEFGTFKPDPRSYRYALDVLGVAPGSLVFVDDQRDNVVAARNAGIPTVEFDPTEVEASIDRVFAAVER